MPQILAADATLAERPAMSDDGLPTPRTTLSARYVRVLVWCKSCRHRRDADLQALVDAGRGDVPLVHLRFRCSHCRSERTDFVVTATEATGRPR
jgi:Zn finger protein HypA/HybF involved in hydrogenase expression